MLVFIVALMHSYHSF